MFWANVAQSQGVIKPPILREKLEGTYSSRSGHMVLTLCCRDRFTLTETTYIKSKWCGTSSQRGKNKIPDSQLWEGKWSMNWNSRKFWVVLTKPKYGTIFYINGDGTRLTYRGITLYKSRMR